MKSRIPRFLAVVALVVLSSACQMTVRLTTNVDANGRGTFGIQMALDQELRGTLAQNNLSSIDELFTRLQTAGWAVSRTEPGGGLDYKATRAFKDKAGFERALEDLGSARSATSPLGGLSTALSFKDSFFKAQTEFRGSVDMSNLVPILKTALNLKTDKDARDLIETLAQGFQFEIQAKLPGSVAINSGDGSVRDGTAVWSPALGSRLDFSASSSAIKTGSLLLIGIPVLLALAGLGWFLLGRRQRPLITEAPTPADRRRITIPVGGPAPELLAIKSDPPQAEVPIVIDLDQKPEPETVPPADAPS